MEARGPGLRGRSASTGVCGDVAQGEGEGEQLGRKQRTRRDTAQRRSPPRDATQTQGAWGARTDPGRRRKGHSGATRTRRARGLGAAEAWTDWARSLALLGR